MKLNAIKIFVDGNLATIIKLELFANPTDFLKTIDTCLDVFGKGSVSYKLTKIHF